MHIFVFETASCAYVNFLKILLIKVIHLLEENVLIFRRTFTFCL